MLCRCNFENRWSRLKVEFSMTRDNRDPMSQIECVSLVLKRKSPLHLSRAYQIDLTRDENTGFIYFIVGFLGFFQKTLDMLTVIFVPSDNIGKLLSEGRCGWWTTGRWECRWRRSSTIGGPSCGRFTSICHWWNGCLRIKAWSTREIHRLWRWNRCCSSRRRRRFSVTPSVYHSRCFSSSLCHLREQ